MRSLALFCALLVAGCTPETSEQRYERELAADTAAGRVIGTLEDTFPADHAALRRRLIGLLDSGASAEAFRAATTQALSQVIEQNRQHLASAPQANLKAVIQSQRIASERMQTHSVSQCAAYVMGQSVSVADADPSLGEGMANATIAILRAAAAGRANPVERSADQITQSDISALRQGMRAAGADAAIIDAAVGNGFMGMPVERQCSGGIAILRGLESMDDSGAARVFAALVSA